MVDEQPKRIGLMWPMIIVASIAAVVVPTLLLMGRTTENRADRVFTLALMLAASIAIFVVEIGAGVVVRQWRRGPEQPATVREVHDGTRVREIHHYGMPPNRYSLPDQRPIDPLSYPAMVSAAYGAGIESRRGGGELELRREQGPDWMPAEALDGVDDVPAPVGWDGDIVM